MKNNIVSGLCGLIFGVGLIVSGMIYPATIINGLRLGSAAFNPALLITFISALLMTWLIYFFAFRRTKPLLAESRHLPSSNKIDAPLIVGALVFGIGWGITGLCPGPNIVGLMFWPYAFYWISFAGILLGGGATWLFLRKNE